jgi:hypothetical protein
VTVEVTVNPTPVMTNPGPFTICSTNATNIPLATTNTGETVLYTWTVSSTSVNVTGFTPQPTPHRRSCCTDPDQQRAGGRKSNLYHYPGDRQLYR